MACKACHLTDVRSSAATITCKAQVRCLRFAKHASNEQHLTAVCQLTKCEACSRTLSSKRDACAAPTAEAFQRIIDDLMRGGGKHKIDKVCGEKSLKHNMMERCVAEAMCVQDRVFLEESGALCTNVDGKSGKFTIRFSAATEDLQHRRGQLGHTDYAGAHLDSVESYVKCMETILRNFCTYGHGGPGRPRLLPIFSLELYEHIRRIHGFFNSDSEGVVMLAGLEVANHGGLRHDDVALLPGTNVTCQDKTHAARRLLQRPWGADEVLKEIIDTVVLERTSIVQRLRNSKDLAQVFQECVAEYSESEIADTHKLLGSMSNALHRFDSVIRPLIRCILLGQQ